jgi:hypothetical protein
MRSRIENGNVVIELPLEKPRRSSTGKTLLIASTRGVKRSDSMFKGRRVSIVANAFIFPNMPTSAAAALAARRQSETDGDDEDEED